jgi:hypothetical protein
MKELPISKGYVALVDDEDFERLSQFRWFVTKRHGTIYASTTIMLHKMVLRSFSSEPLIDHKNHNGLDCQKENLRTASHSLNGANRRKTKGTSRFKGVSWDKRKQLWRAQIGKNYKTTFLGWFKNETDAAKAYDTAAVAFFGEFALINFPNSSHEQIA